MKHSTNLRVLGILSLLFCTSCMAISSFPQPSSDLPNEFPPIGSIVKVVLGLPYDVVSSDEALLVDSLAEMFHTSEDVLFRFARQGPWTSVALRVTGDLTAPKIDQLVNEYHACVDEELRRRSAEGFDEHGFDCTHIAPVPIDYLPASYFHLAVQSVAGETYTPNRRLLANDDAPASERDALELLYDHLGGEMWTVQTNWMDDDATVCSWFGVTCAVIGFDEGGDNNTHVTEVRLPENGLTLQSAIATSGRRHMLSSFQGHRDTVRDSFDLSKGGYRTLIRERAFRADGRPGRFGRDLTKKTAELAKQRLATRRLFSDDTEIFTDEMITGLPFLKVFDVSLNDLTGGTLPENIGNWQYLQSIAIFQSGITGTIPESLADTSLRHFIAEFEGYCPAPFDFPGTPCDVPFEKMLGHRFWAEFQYAVSAGVGNALTGNMDVFGQIPTLETLWVSNNPLGPGEWFPESFCSLANLKGFDSVATGLEGSIPDCIGEMTSLHALTIGNGRLSGTLPDSIGSLVNLYSLEIPASGVSGTIPESIVNITMLFQLHLMECAISGTLPEAIGNLPVLGSILLFVNNLEGEFPASMRTQSPWLGGPITFAVDENNFVGSFEDWDFSSWTSIFLFSLMGNQFSGSLPSMAPTNASYVFFSRNQFTGEWTEDLLPINVEAVYLESVPLSGSFPTVLNRYASLNHITMSDNSMSGPIHESICGLESLAMLELINMPLSGTLPECFGDLDALETIVLRNLDITGGLPSTIGDMESLYSISVKDCKLDASSLPSGLNGHPTLFELFLSGNQLRGSVNGYLSTLSLCPQLFLLDLSSNYIEGVMLSVYFITIAGRENFPTLYSFNMANNRLSGKLTYVLADLPNLRVLDVSNNSLTGEIHTAFARMSIFRATENMFGCDERAPDYDDSFCTEKLPEGFSLTGQYLDSGEGFSCPILSSTIYTDAIVEIDSLSYNHSLCRCDKDTYGSHGRCTKCLSGGHCPGGSIEQATTDAGEVVPLPIDESLHERYVVEARVYADTGYYPSPSADRPAVMLRCLMESIDEERCNPSQSTDFACRSGYTGRLCGSCSPGYYQQGSACQKCPESQATAVFVFCVFVLLIVVFFALVIQHKRLMRLDDAMKAFLFFLQTIVIVYENTGFVWPESTLRMNNLFKYGSVSIASFSCINEDDPPTPYDDYLLSVTQPLMLLGLVAIYAVLGLIYLRVRNEFAKEFEMHMIRSVHAFLFGLNVIYLPVTVTVLEVFMCEHDDGDGKDYMQFYPNVECDENGDWGKMRDISIVMFIFHVLFIPAGFGFLLYYNRNRLFTDRKIIGLLRFLYSPYKRQYYWYELATFVRRMVLGIFATMLGSGSLMTPFLIALVILLSGAVHSYFRPFNTFILNTLESIVHLVLGFTFICGSLFTIFEDENQDAESTVLEVFVMFMSVGVMLLFVLLGLRIVVFPKHKFFLRWTEQSLAHDESFDGVDTDGMQRSNIGLEAVEGEGGQREASVRNLSATNMTMRAASPPQPVLVGSEAEKDLYPSEGVPMAVAV